MRRYNGRRKELEMLGISSSSHLSMEDLSHRDRCMEIRLRGRLEGEDWELRLRMRTSGRRKPYLHKGQITLRKSGSAADGWKTTFQIP